jgi:plasmid stabilization system protein ParE
MRVIWSAFAEKMLDEIFAYYELNASPEIALKIVTGIITEPNKLIENPYIGQLEDMLCGRAIQYRYLVYKSYKIIYSVDEKNGYIKIADVFDTRQKPAKIKREK